MRITALVAILMVAPAASPGAQSNVQNANAELLTAERALERGDCRVASQSYLNAIQQAADARLAARATEVTLDCGQYPSAEQAVARWRVLAPEDTAALLAAVRAQLGRSRIAAARAPLQEWLRKTGDQQAQLAGIDQLIEHAGVDATLKLLRDTPPARPGSAPVLVRLAQLAIEGWDFNLALNYAERARQAGAAPGVLAVLRARAHAGLGQTEAALADARAAGEQQPFAVAETLLWLGRETDAEREFLKLSAEPQLRSQAERRLALLAFERSDYRAAEERFTNLLRDQDSAALAVYYLGILAERRDDDESALRRYELLIETSLESAARRRVAGIYYRDGEQRQAVRLLAPENQGSIVERIGSELAVADLLATEGAVIEGIARLDTALQSYPAHPELAYQRAVLLERTDATAAIAALEVQLGERPDDGGLANALGFTLADHQRELPRAERLVRSALQAQPDNPAVLDSMGWVLYRRGQAQAAIPYLERAFRLFRDGEIGAHLGEVLWQTGRKDEARATWTRALAADPDNMHLAEVAHRYAPELSAPPPPRFNPANDTVI